jgi:hypothetical protein
MLDIVNKISSEISKSFPRITIYVWKKRRNMARPSFALEFINLLRSDLNGKSFKDTISIKITYYANLPNNEIDAIDQINAFNKLKKIFEKGFLEVDGNKLRIEKLEGGSEDKEIFLKVDFEVPGTRQESENYDLMKSVNIRRSV